MAIATQPFECEDCGSRFTPLRGAICARCHRVLCLRHFVSIASARALARREGLVCCDCGEVEVEDPRGWVLYDGACGFCSRWIPFWAPVLRRRGLEIAPLQSSWVGRRLQLTEAELLDDIRILTADDALFEGADAYREMMRRVWWAFPLYALSIVPGPKRVFDACYRAFARHRYRFSAACGMHDAPSRP